MTDQTFGHAAICAWNASQRALAAHRAGKPADPGLVLALRCYEACGLASLEAMARSTLAIVAPNGTDEIVAVAVGGPSAGAPGGDAA